MVITPQNIENEVIGSLLIDTELLMNDVGAALLPTDFTQEFSKKIFSAMQTLLTDNLHVSDKEIVKLLQVDSTDINMVQEYIYLVKNRAEPINFEHNADLLKKYGLLRDLESCCDISAWYTNEPLRFEEQLARDRKLKEATIHDIIESIFGRIVQVSDPYVQSKDSVMQQANEGLYELIASLEETPDFGMPMIDDTITTLCRGARKTKLYMFSGNSGAGKTRMMLAQAVKSSIPITWDVEKQKWVYTGGNEVSGFCSTEMQFEEVQTILLAAVAGVPEDHILEGCMSTAERERVMTAAKIITRFAANLVIWRMPDPNIKQIVSGVRRMKITHRLENLFFDYIHVSPNLISEYSGAVREDVALLMVANALKNLANELNLFIWTATQYNVDGAKADFITESSLRGSRALADKLDTGAGLRVPTKDELAKVKTLVNAKGITPNLFIDFYKNRGNKYKSIRVWMYADLGVMRYKTLFVTDWSFNLLEISPTKIDLGLEEELGSLCDLNGGV